MPTKTQERQDAAIREKFQRDLVNSINFGSPDDQFPSIEVTPTGEVVLTWETKEAGLHAYFLETRLTRVDGKEDEVTDAFGPPLDEKEYIAAASGVSQGCLTAIKVMAYAAMVTGAITGYIVWRIWG